MMRSAYRLWHSAVILQVCSQRSGSRPSGVGLLIAGRDMRGCHLYQVCPSGNLYDHVAAAIGMFLWSYIRLSCYPTVFSQIWVFHSFFRGKITSIKNIFGEIPSTYGQLFVARFDFTRSAGAKGGDFRTLDKGNMYRCGRRSWDTLPSSWWRWVEFTFSWADNRHLITCLVHDTSLIYSIW